MATHEHTIPLLVVCGPTASGKTALAVQLAKLMNGEVVSADSMQIYRHMDIGTAKPSAAEQEGIPHHLLDVAEPWESFSLVQYLQLARAVVADIHQRGRLPILAGGTGLYIQSLVDNIQFEEIATDPDLRAKLEQVAREKGTSYLWEQLRDCDPELADRLHPNNKGRIIRGLEVYRLTGTTMTQLQFRSRKQPSPYRLCMLGLNFLHREALYRRIDLRVELMFRQGLEEEAKQVRRMGLSQTAAQAIGYKELFDYFDGQRTLEEAKMLIQQRSRAYAKRQMTWLRRDSRIHWLCWEDYPDTEVLVDAALGIARQALDHTIAKGW